MGRKRKYIVALSEDERKRLASLVESETDAGTAVNRDSLLSARILLLSDENTPVGRLTNHDVAHNVGVCSKTVVQVRKDFLENGIESIFDHRRGRDVPKLDDAARAKLFELIHSDPPRGRVRWTLRLLANRLVELGLVDSISHETVRKELIKGRDPIHV